MEECEINILEGMGRHMSYYDVITNVERKIEREQAYMELHRDGLFCSENLSTYEAIGYVKNVVLDTKKSGNSMTVISFEYEKPEGKIQAQSFRTNKEPDYYKDCKGKKVYLSGIIYGNCDKKKNKRIPILYVSSCYSVEDRQNIIETCETMTEDEKRSFQKKIQSFSLELQKDLSERCVALSKKRIPDKEEELPATYIEVEELEALFDMQKAVIPAEFRTEYNKCKRMLNKYLSGSEKKNYMKAMSNILNIDWINQYYKEIDVDAAINKSCEDHIGHEMQIEDLRTQLLICNSTRKAPRTLCFIGRSCGCGSLASAFAEAIGIKYEVMDLTGKKDVEYLSGSSKIYENGRCGLVFEKIMKVGTHGLLIFKNIDTYDAAILDFITTLIEKKNYTDIFMEIPMDLSNLWVICTSSTTKNLPMSLRREMHEITFEKISEKQLIRVINEIMLPKRCEQHNIIFNNKLSDQLCKILIYQLSHNEIKKLEMNVESLVIKMVAEGKKEFPQLTVKELNEYFQFAESGKYMLDNYVTDLGDLENKYYWNYDMYPDSVKERANELLEDIRYGDDWNMKNYAVLSLRYLVNPTKGSYDHYKMGQIENSFKQTRFGQDGLACQIDDALLAERLSGDNKRMTVLGLWGPPGTGKTTAAEAIAKALNRGYVKLNFGGASNASIVKGQNKSVPNAGPSLLMRELSRKSGTYSYVVNFDEFDKGTAESYEAFHEFLDSVSESYYDEYLECNIPKNNFIIILTFNDISRIPTPILDRMRLITVPGYSLTTKKKIVKNMVLESYAERLKVKNVSITDTALDLLMREYSVASGIRDVEKDIEKLLVRLIKKYNKYSDFFITEDIIREVLGSKRTLGLSDMGNKAAVPGQAMALGVSGYIGSCIAVQVAEDPYQKAEVEVSGLLKDACMESLSDAMSYARRTLKKELPKLHISFRAPSIPKDGSSAGVAMYMAVMSCVLNKKLEGCAFTGSIDAFGNVGIVSVEEKLCAAEREGIARVYIPWDNYEYLKENKILDQYNVDIIPVKHVDELNSEFFELEVS